MSGELLAISKEQSPDSGRASPPRADSHRRLNPCHVMLMNHGMCLIDCCHDIAPAAFYTCRWTARPFVSLAKFGFHLRARSQQDSPSVVPVECIVCVSPLDLRYRCTSVSSVAIDGLPVPICILASAPFSFPTEAHDGSWCPSIGEVRTGTRAKSAQHDGGVESKRYSSLMKLRLCF